MEQSLEQLVEFVETAFRHGYTETDIRHAIGTHIKDVLLAGYEDTYGLVGFDCIGNPIEIMYNRIDDKTIEVFHAMKCRPSFLKRVGL
ncbi:MAG: hypothetical protein Ta2G_21560 [Termitinemataceae bacterium]|nr:MAG: hypothetical protein Ta2G_21560 [Termitinemataceae bacterium]